MKKQTVSFYLCLFAVAWLGLRIGSATVTPTAQAAPFSASMAAPFCTATVDNVKIQKNPGGNNFGVKWKFPSRCQNSAEVALTVTKLSGAERTDRKSTERGIEIANFSFIGDGDLNPIRKAKATIRATGVLAAKNTLTVNLGFSSGTGSSAPTPVPTFRLSGQIKNQQGGAPILGVKLTFQLVGAGPFILTPPPVETDSQGRWQQSGFPAGTKVRITASKRFFVIEPESRLVSAGGDVQFSGRPN